MSDESQESVMESQEPEAPATPEPDELTTWKKRLAGKDQALTKTKADLEAAKAELAALSKWKAEREESDLTEVEKLQRRLAEAEERAAAVEAEKERIRLTASYPLAVEFYGDDPLPSEERLNALQQRLAATAATGDEDENDVDENLPRRSMRGTKDTKDMSVDELRAQLRRESAGLKSLADVPGWVGG